MNIIYIVIILLNTFSYSIFCDNDILKTPIVIDGKIRHLNTISKVYSYEIFNDSSFANHNNKNTILKLIFNDEKIFNEKYFLISNSSIKNLLELEKSSDNLYSFNDLILKFIKNFNIIKNINNKGVYKESFNKDLINVYCKILFFIKINLINDKYHFNFNLNEKYFSKYEFLISNSNYKMNYNLYNDLGKFKFLLNNFNLNSFYFLNSEEANILDFNENVISSNIKENIKYLTYKIYKSVNTKNFKEFVCFYNDYVYSNFSNSLKNKIYLDSFFDKLNFIKLILALCFLDMIFSFLLFFLRSNDVKYILSFLIKNLCTIFLFIFIFVRCIISEKPPVTNLFESMLFVNFLLTFFLSIILFNYNKNIFFVYSVVFTTFLQLIIYLYDYYYDGSIKLLMPVLNTNFWLIFHVVTISTAYVFCLLFGILNHIILYYYFFNKHENALLVKKIFNFNIFLCNIALFSSVLGTILGGIWADHSWGRFWGWDPKENGALLIVLWLVFVLHYRHTMFYTPLLFIFLGVLTNAIVAIAWFGINLLNTGLHSYGFVKGIGSFLFYFCLFELFYISFFALLNIKKGKFKL